MSARFVIDRQIQFAANGVSERCRQWHASKQHQPSTRKALAVHRKIDCHRPSKPIPGCCLGKPGLRHSGV